MPKKKLLGCPGDKKFGSNGPTAVSPFPVSPNSAIGTFTSSEAASPKTPIVSYLLLSTFSSLAKKLIFFFLVSILIVS